MSGSGFPEGLCTLQVIHHVISQPSTASWRLAFSSRHLSGACCSQCEGARNAELQGLTGYLYTPRSFDMPTVRFHGAHRSPHRSDARCATPPSPPDSADSARDLAQYSADTVGDTSSAR